MKTWWKAVCDEHKEMCDIFVNNIHVTTAYLKDRSDPIADWMHEHRGCALRLIHHDLDLDTCFNAGYKSSAREEEEPAEKRKREREERKLRSQLMWDRVASGVNEFDVAILGTRYGGAYEGGRWIAWVGDLEWLDDYQACDIDCQIFFEDYTDAPVGRGETPQAALDDLRRRAEESR